MKTFQHAFSLAVLVVILEICPARAFQASFPQVSSAAKQTKYPPFPSTRPTATSLSPPSSSLQLVENAAALESLLLSNNYDPSTTILLAEESWRQYVPLGVSLLVITDILLGSPAANSILGIVRAQEAAEEKDSNDTSTKSRGLLQVSTKGERVDSEVLANAALERARNALEWNTEREKLKTDADRMEDMRKKMDNQLRDFDEKRKS